MLKKTLLLTSALASAALMSTASLAELKVSATQEWEYSYANEQLSSANSKQLGSETTVKFSGGGSLGGSNSYTMYYDLSNAGQDTVQANIKIGGVDFEIGQNNSIGNEDVKALLPFVNNRFTDIAGAGISSDTIDLSSSTASVGVNLPAGSVGAFSVGYNPNMGNGKTQGTDAGIKGGAVSRGTGVDKRDGSAISASFKGSLGVSGLTVGVGILEGNNPNPLNTDVDSLTYGVAYNFGSISVGYQRIENTNNAAKTSKNETTVDNFGIAFAATDSVSLGLYRSDSDKEVNGARSGVEMETTVLQIGYKLGAAKLAYDYVKSDNYKNSATNELELHKVKLMMAF